MSLQTYEKKRNFKLTPEPKPGRTAQVNEPIFVVQLHHARARHYDFRLQVDGALKSWAVPKGPSFDPAVKRLAVEVEDHPVAYAEFEGDIPSGHYGAGHVDIFDRGTWSTSADPRAQLAKGHLEFELHGDRLQGAWHLVRSNRDAKQPQWMLFKAKDGFVSSKEADDFLAEPPKAGRKSAARKKGKTKIQSDTAIAKRKGKPATKVDWTRRALSLENAIKRKLLPGPFAPQLARSAASAPQGDSWLHETKWDGYRILVTIVKGKVQLWSRNALEWTARLPSIVNAFESLSVRDAQLDGELIVGDADADSFNELQAVLSGQSNTPLLYAAFDLPHIDGVSLADCTLVDRKAVLQELLQTTSSPHLLYSDHHVGDGPMVFAAAAKRGLEGILSKRAASKYRAGRGNDWVKVKSVLSDEFAIVGYTKPRGSRAGLGALLLGRPDSEGGWEYAGRMGSGFSAALLRKLTRLLAAAQRANSPVSETSLVNRDTGKPIWVDPKHVVEVYYRGIGKEGLLRQASLKALREDKSSRDLKRDPDRAVKAESAQSGQAKQRRPARSADRGAKVRSKASAARKDGESDLSYISHPERVVFPKDGYTKLQVAEYYERVMPWFLPQIANRPLSIVRCPDGTKSACFFQKHHTAQIGKHVNALPMRDTQGAKVRFLYVEDADGVRDLVQMNVLEFHPWGTTIDQLEKTDTLTFDLDPGPEVNWSQVVAAAELIRQILLDLKLQSFVKLSGGKGLHVVVPLDPVQPWDIAKQFCRGIAAALASDRPQRFIDVATKSQRTGRIFVDYLRNGRGSTSVAAYALRARTGAPVAMPIAWRELRDVAGADVYSLRNAAAYLAKRKQDPWEGLRDLQQTFGGYVGSIAKAASAKSSSKRRKR